MTTTVDHVAIRVQHFDWYLNFFRNVLDMEITLTDPEGFDVFGKTANLTTEGLNQVWVGGIQLQRAGASDVCEDGMLTHIGIAISGVDEVLARVYALDGIVQAEGKPRNWFVLPNGLMIELVAS